MTRHTRAAIRANRFEEGMPFRLDRARGVEDPERPVRVGVIERGGQRASIAGRPPPARGLALRSHSGRQRECRQQQRRPDQGEHHEYRPATAAHGRDYMATIRGRRAQRRAQIAGILKPDFATT